MSNIIEKPFSWANKIVRAVFKGSPNLITTSDLNRQIEALKKEMYVLQQSSGAIISDLETSISEGHLNVTGSYVFCLGAKFNIDLTGVYTLPDDDSEITMELRLYAKKELVTYDDDFTKAVSGAKFNDGTTQPAANHYVYTESKVVWAEVTAPNSDFVYAAEEGYEYVCTLIKAEAGPHPHAGYYASRCYVQAFTVPMGKSVVDVHAKYGRFDQFELATYDKVYADLVPSADDDWRDIAHKLWSRLYTLEKRLFMETSHSTKTQMGGLLVNGIDFDYDRSFQKHSQYDDNGMVTVDLRYSFKIVGNICFVTGYTSIQKNSDSPLVSRNVSIDIGNTDNELPRADLTSYPSSGFLFSSYTIPATAGETSNVKVSINWDKLIFEKLPEHGGEIYWSGAFCFCSRGFWQYSMDDRYGYFNDRKEPENN